MNILWSCIERYLTGGLVAIALSLPGACSAQDTPANHGLTRVVDPTGGLPVEPTAEKEAYRIIKLRPKVAEPVTKPRLFPARSELRPGHAAPIFLRQNFEATTAMEKRKQFLKDALTTGKKRLDDPLLLDVENLNLYRMGELERAAYCEQAGWEYPLYDSQYEGGGIRILLPDVQESRVCALYLCELGRCYIAQGRIDQAERAIRIGLALTRHTSETPFMVVKLVVAAQCGYYQEVIEELIQSPDAPNYYWDLASLPRPMIETRSAVQWEWNILAQSYPELLNLDAVATQERWQVLYDTVLAGILEMNDGRVPKTGTPELEQFKHVWAKKARELLPQLDSTQADRVASMSDAEVSIRYWWLRVQLMQNLLFSPALLEPHMALDQLAIQEKKVAEIFKGEEFVLTSIMPFVTAVQMRAIGAREQKFALLRTIEAIRHWSAGHDGTLPESLTALDLPAPLDPLSGAAFQYQRSADGRSAELHGRSIKIDSDVLKHGFTYRLELTE